MIEAKAFGTFITSNSLFNRERLSVNIKLTLHNALSRSVMIYACPAWEFAADAPPFEIAALAKRGSPHNWYISKAHSGTTSCAWLSKYRIFMIT
jgi:hypothetical protein